MTSLRLRMIEDMQIRNLAVSTQESYIQQVSRFARHFWKSPELLGPEQIRAYQVYLTNEKKLSVTVQGSDPPWEQRWCSSVAAMASDRFREITQHVTPLPLAGLGDRE